ncbi:MAG: FGGY family carbohydrate kinase, partial [Sphaerochaetaceae bacterium]
VDPYFSGTKLRWVLEHEEKVREVYERGEAFFGTVDTWLIYLLTGKKSYTTDQTNASRTLLFDIRHLRWSDELLNLFKVELIQLPEVLSSDSIFGTTDLNRLLPASVPITGVLGDSQAASVGEGLFEAGDTKVTMGTGSSLMVNTVDHVKSSSGLVSTICWSTKDKTSYGLEGIIVSCGSTLTWLIEEMKFVSNVREIDSIAESTCDSSPVSFIPALGGLGAPYWNRKATASFQGLRFGVTKEKMVRAVVESYPFILHDIIMSVKHDLQNADICLKADGGMTNSGITMQLISDILQTEVFVDRRKESSTIGAALFSFLGNGLLTLSQLKDMAKNSKYTVYRPKQNEKLIASYDLWKKRMQSRRSE